METQREGSLEVYSHSSSTKTDDYQPSDDHRSISIGIRLMILSPILCGYICSVLFPLNPFNIMIYPLCFITAMVAYCVYWKGCKNGRINPCYIPGSSLEMSFMLLFVLVIPIGYMNHFILGGLKLLCSKMNHQTGFHHSPSVNSPWKHLCEFIKAFIIAALFEECEKALALWFLSWLKMTNKERKSLKHARSYIWIGLAVGMGFGTGEAILYACWNSENVSSQIGSVMVRVFLCVPLHSVWGLLWGIGLARKRLLDDPNKERSWLWIGLVPWLFHGMYDFVIFEVNLIIKKYPEVYPSVESVAWVMGSIIIFYAVCAYHDFLSDVRKKHNELLKPELSSKDHTPQDLIAINFPPSHHP